MAVKEATAPAPAVADTPVAAKPTRPAVLAPARFEQEEFFHCCWGATIPDHEWDQLTTSTYWKSVATRLHVGDEVVCRNVSLTRYARLLCVSVDPAYVTVAMRVLQDIELEPVAVRSEIYGGFEITYAGMIDKWTIVRIADGHVMGKGHESMPEARQRVMSDLLPHVTR